MSAAAAQAEFDPFDEPASARVQAAAGEGQSVVVRRDDAAAEFDPFEEPARDDGGAPAAPPSARVAIAPQATGFDPFEAEDSRAGEGSEDASGMADRSYAIEEAFEEPRVAQSPRVAIAPAVENEVEAEPDAVNEKTSPNIIVRDAPGGVAPTPLDEVVMPAEEGDDEVVAPADDLEEAFGEPGREDEAEPDDDGVDPRMQQAPGRDFDLRPLDAPQGLTPEQDAVRREQLEQERLRAEQDCEEIIASVQADDIKSVSLDIANHGEPGEDYPFECGLGEQMFQPRNWPQITYMWKASALCNKPLYFEQVAVERYGHSLPPVVQPLVSGAHFFGTLPILPYKMGLTTPNECIYTLGYYRPGSCAPYMIPAVPFTWRAAAFEAGAWTGGSFIFP